jgi:hypothetical protein
MADFKIKDKHLLLIFIFAILLITRFAFLFPANFLHISGVFRMEDIGLGLIVLLAIITFNKKSQLPKYVALTYYVLIFYILLEFLRGIYLYDQTIIETLKVERHLFFGLLIFVTPKIVNYKTDFYKLTKVLLFFSVISSISFILQAILKVSFFNGYYQINQIGGITVFRAFDIFPVIMIFLSFYAFYHIMNNSRKSNYYFFVIVGVILLILNVTRGHWIAYLFVCLIIILISRKHKTKMIVGTIFTIIVLASILPFVTETFHSIVSDVKDKEGTFGYRLEVLDERIVLINQTNPFFGLGLVSYENNLFDNHFVAGGPNSNDDAVSQGDIGFAGLIGHLGWLGLLIYFIHIFTLLIYMFNNYLNKYSIEEKAILASFIGIGIWTIIITINGLGIYGMDLVLVYLAVGLVPAITHKTNKIEKPEEKGNV